MPRDPAPASTTAAAGLSIRARILLSLLVVLLPAAGALAWLLAADLRQTREEAFARVRILADASAASIEDTLQRAEAGLARVARHPALLALDAQRCDAVIADFDELIPDYMALTARDLKGAVVCHHAGHAEDPTRPWAAPLVVAAPHAEGFSVSDVVTPPPGRRPAVTLSQPLVDAAGQPIGLLTVAVDLLSLNGRLLRAAPAEAVVSVVDRQGSVVLRSVQPESFVGTPASAAGLRLDAMPASGTFVATGLDGVGRLYAAATLTGPGWRVFAGLPQAEVFAAYREAVARTTAFGVGGALLALALAVTLSAAIAWPITRLRQNVLRVAAGETSVRAVPEGPPEIRQLAQSFNHMLDQRMLAEARLTGIFDTALDAIISADEQQRIVHANAAASQLLRCPLDSIVGSPLEQFVPLAARAGHAAAVRAFGDGDVAARHMGRRRDVSALRADGTEFPAEATISRLAVGGTRLYTVMLRDVTAVRLAERELSDSEALLRRLLEHLPEAVFVDSGNRISFVNQAAQRLFGGDESALLGRSPLDLIAPESQAEVRERMASLSAEVPIAGLTELQIVRLDGEQRTAESIGALVQHNGDRSIIVVLRDVSELRRARAELEASQADLRRLVAALDRAQDTERRRISRELHDDLQQTLAAIRMDASMLHDAAPGALADAAAAATRIDELAAAAITSTRRLIEDLRPQALEELGLLLALKELARGFAQRSHTPCEVLAADAATDTEPKPELAMCLYRVAQEALSNVAKHARAANVRITLSLADGTWRLCVDDDGRGMRPDDRRKLRSFGLLGMQERARALGGELRIESAPGSGTSVRVSLPPRD